MQEQQPTPESMESKEGSRMGTSGQSGGGQEQPLTLAQAQPDLRGRARSVHALLGSEAAPPSSPAPPGTMPRVGVVALADGPPQGADPPDPGGPPVPSEVGSLTAGGSHQASTAGRQTAAPHLADSNEYDDDEGAYSDSDAVTVRSFTFEPFPASEPELWNDRQGAVNEAPPGESYGRQLPMSALQAKQERLESMLELQYSGRPWDAVTRRAVSKWQKKLAQLNKNEWRTLAELKAGSNVNTQPALRVTGTIAGHPCRILIDSGAEADVLDSAWAARHAIPSKPAMLDGRPLTFKGFDGQQREAAGVATVDMDLGGHKARRPMALAPLCGQDAILGTPWLAEYNPRLNFQARMVEFDQEVWAGKRDKRRLVRKTFRLYAPIGLGPDGNALHNVQLCSLRAALREGQKEGAQLALLQVRVAPQEGEETQPAPKKPPDPGEPGWLDGKQMPEKVRRVVLEYPDRFKAFTLPDHRGDADLALELEPGHTPPNGRIWRYTPEEEAEIERQVRELLEKGFIEPSTSPFGAPVLLVKKKDGSLRLCVDYRRLNAILLKDSFPLPRIDDLTDRLTGAKYFTTIDLQQGYHQLRIREGDEHKTAFRTPHGHWQWRVAPFGVATAPPVFMRWTSSAMGEYIRKFVLVYLDDVLIYSKTEEEHAEHVRLVLEVFRKHSMHAKLSKCEFGLQRVEFLGHIITADGITMDPKKVAGIREWPTPSGTPAQCKTQLRSFLGAAGFYRRMVPKFSHITNCLTDLLHDKTEWKWGPEEQAAFEGLKQIMTSEPVMIHAPDYNLPFIVQTDGSGYAMGAVLMQEPAPKVKRVVAYMSHKITGAESRYHAYEKEMLAVVTALKEWRHYLGPRHFMLYTDNMAVSKFLKQPEVSPRQARWLLTLSEFNFSLHHIPGKENVVADALSRRPDHAPSSPTKAVGPTRAYDVLDPNFPDHNSTQEWSAAQTQEQLTRALNVCCIRLNIMQVASTRFNLWTKSSTPAPVMIAAYHLRARAPPKQPAQEAPKPPARGPRAGRAATTKEQQEGTQPAPAAPKGKQQRTQPTPDTQADPAPSPTHPPNYTRNLWEQRLLDAAAVDPAYQELLAKVQSKENTSFQEVRGLLWLAPHPGSEPRLYIPATARREALMACHDQHGHLGRDKTLEYVQRMFWWPSLTRDVEDYVATCPVCCTTKGSTQRPHGKMQPLSVPTQCWESVSMDYITGFPRTPRGHDSILVIVDRLSKRVILIPTNKEVTAEQTAELFFREVFRQHGMARDIVSDRDPKFTSNFWTQLMQLLNTKRAMSSANHPQTDGQTERMNRLVEDMLRCYVQPDQTDWDQHLVAVEFAYNNSVHASTGFTPFYLTTGRHPITPMVLALKEFGPETRSKSPAADAFIGQLREDLQRAKQAMAQAQARQKHYADAKRREAPAFKVGQQVLLNAAHLNIHKGDTTPKLAPRWVGPFEVTEVISKLAYRLKLPPSMRVHNVFYVGLLKEAPANGRFPREVEPPPAPIVHGNQAYFVVDHIVTHYPRKATNQSEATHYLIRWKGYPPWEDTKEPAKNIQQDVPEEVAAYWERRTLQVTCLMACLHAYFRSALGPRGNI